MSSDQKRGFLGLILLLLLFCSMTGGGITGECKNFVVDTEITYQTIEGFGASIAWYENWVTAHPNKRELYDLIFKELGLDILRLQNWYGKQSNVGAYSSEIVREATRSLERPVQILISSWSPPASLKSNNNVEGGGTLKKENGQYVYEKFAEYWHDSLMAYEKAGIIPEYISIQNEPDYKAEWNSCLFSPEETEETAGYDRALAAVYHKLQEMGSPPKIVGPETIGIGYETVKKYSEKMDMDQIYAGAHHLYHGGEDTNPTTYIFNMRETRELFSDKPIFQTEFERGDGFTNAWIIHNSLVEENINAYLYWDLIWVDRGLVTVESPWQRSSWKTEKGFFKTEMYYALQHYARFTDPGYKRVEVVGDSNRLKVSAFISPDGDRLVVVALNTYLMEEKLKLDFLGFKAQDSRVYRTCFMRKNGEEFADLGALEESNPLILPGRSMATVVLNRFSEGK